MIGPILAVTLSVPNIQTSENAYKNTLRYETVERGEISEELSNLWNAPLVTGRKYIIMQPESRVPVYLRFIESPNVIKQHTLDTYGWNAIELHAQNVDEIPKKLKDTNFDIVSLPRNLSSSDDIKAMQVLGPSKELIYFTTVKNPAYGLGSATSFIDRVFIVINAGKTMDSHLQFYKELLKLDVSTPQIVRMSAMNKILNRDPEDKHPLATAKVGNGFVIELDEYPEGTKTREKIDGDIPSGISIVSFYVDKLSSFPTDFYGETLSPSGKIYNSKKSGLVIGPNKEWLELIQK
jgi:hypothetical protein